MDLKNTRPYVDIVGATKQELCIFNEKKRKRSVTKTR
jgi:hypothetical protein